MPKLTDEQREVQRFRVHHPDFVESPKNVKIINDFLRVNKLSTTLENLQAAFASEFLQLDHSNAPAPAPVVPVTPTPAPASVPPPPARPMVLPPWEKKYGRALDADMVRNISFEEMRSYLRDQRFGSEFKRAIDELGLTRSDLGY